MHNTAGNQRNVPAPWARLAMSAAMVVAMSGAMAGLAQAQPMPGGPGAEGPHRAMAHRMGPGRDGGAMLSDRVLDSVAASPDQKSRIKDIMGKARDDMHKQHEADKGLHQQMMAILAAPQVDAAAAEGVRQKLAARHEEASKRHLQAMLDASAVLTPEQRQKLAERAKTHREMHDRHRRERESVAPRS